MCISSHFCMRELKFFLLQRLCRSSLCSLCHGGRLMDVGVRRHPVVTGPRDRGFAQDAALVVLDQADQAVIALLAAQRTSA